MSNFDEIKKTSDGSEDLSADATEVAVDAATDNKAKRKLPKLNWRSNRKLRLGATATAITPLA